MITSLVIFFLVLSILILIHELGHFLVARKNGVWVEEFGFGLPPRMFGKKIGETIYSVNWLPFGGFVKLHGENSEDGVSVPTRAFINKSKKAKTAIIVAGVIMNFLLAIFAFSIVSFFSGIPRETGEVKVVEVAASSPAQVAGILVGDIILKIDKLDVKKNEDFIKTIDEKKGKRVEIEVKRDINENVEIKKFTVTPRENPPENEGPMGVSINDSEIYFPPIWQRPFIGIAKGFEESLFWGNQVFFGIIGIFQDAARGQAPKDLGSPIAIYAVTTEATKYGILALINLVGILSVNLAILNIMPFPALDGGRLLFIFIEGIFGKKVAPKIEGYIHTAGMVLLLTLLGVLVFGDIRKLIQAGSVSGFLDSVVK